MEDKKYQELLDRLEKAEKNAQIARDWVEISNLHGRYNHLCLGHYWEKICDELFAKKTPGVKAEIVESGVFHGIDLANGDDIGVFHLCRHQLSQHVHIQKLGRTGGVEKHDGRTQ